MMYLLLRRNHGKLSFPGKLYFWNEAFRGKLWVCHVRHNRGNLKRSVVTNLVQGAGMDINVVFAIGALCGAAALIFLLLLERELKKEINVSNSSRRSAHLQAGMEMKGVKRKVRSIFRAFFYSVFF